MNIRSSAFSDNSVIPRKYTGEGSDISPPIEWDSNTSKIKEFALICDDPDAPTPEPWVHWIIYNIPSNIMKLPEGVLPTEKIPELNGATQGKNSWGKIGYKGPMPPKGHGWHRYFFKLYALNAPLNLKAGINKKELEKAMEDHIIGEARLTGKYKRD